MSINKETENNDEESGDISNEQNKDTESSKIISLKPNQSLSVDRQKPLTEADIQTLFPDVPQQGFTYAERLELMKKILEKKPVDLRGERDFGLSFDSIHRTAETLYMLYGNKVDKKVIVDLLTQQMFAIFRVPKDTIQEAKIVPPEEVSSQDTGEKITLEKSDRPFLKRLLPKFNISRPAIFNGHSEATLKKKVL